MSLERDSGKFFFPKKVLEEKKIIFLFCKNFGRKENFFLVLQKFWGKRK